MDGMEEKLNAFLSNPDALEKVMGMARALGGGDTPKTEEEKPSDGLGSLLGGLQNMDPKLLSGLLSILGESGKSNDKEALLLSLKPYLREERQHKLEKAAQMLRIARAARIGIQTFMGGEDNA